MTRAKKLEKRLRSNSRNPNVHRFADHPYQPDLNLPHTLSQDDSKKENGGQLLTHQQNSLDSSKDSASPGKQLFDKNPVKKSIINLFSLNSGIRTVTVANYKLNK